MDERYRTVAFCAFLPVVADDGMQPAGTAG